MARLWLFAVLLACSAPVASPRTSPGLHSIVRDTMAGSTLPGVAVIATRAGRVELAAAYGEANRENHLAMTLDTPMRIGSVTKVFTAVAVMELVAAGKLRLDDPISAYVDVPSTATIRQLLAFRSGLPNSLPALGDDPDRTPAQTLAVIRTLEPTFAAGAREE